MTRSLLLPYIFIMLAISYIGGTILFRFMDTQVFDKMIFLFDARLVQDQALFLYPLVTLLVTFGLMIICSKSGYTRWLVYVVCAIHAMMFGLGAGYLLSNELSFFQYAFWWFPFQLAISFFLFMFAAILTPPFFMKTIGKRTMNKRGLFLVFCIILILFLLEQLIFHIVVK